MEANGGEAKMDERKSASETAEVTVLIRALACFEEDEKIRGRDSLARLFLPEERRKKLLSGSYRQAVKERIAAKRAGIYEYVVARTAYFDEIFENALKDGAPQIVSLGAGYDSRAWRSRAPHGSKNAKIFEVDAPLTQERKVFALKANNIDCGGVVFVPADFEKDDLFRQLAGGGYDAGQRTFFLWEGVTPYLSPEAVDATLRAITQNSNGILAFDYLNAPPGSENEIIRGDERILFGMNKARIEPYLRNLGYEILENLDPGEISARYLTRADGKPFGEIRKTMNFMKAAIVN
jgi:methyltransferase (TIGR00027 family)